MKKVHPIAAARGISWGSTLGGVLHFTAYHLPGPVAERSGLAGIGQEGVAGDHQHRKADSNECKGFPH